MTDGDIPEGPRVDPNEWLLRAIGTPGWWKDGRVRSAAFSYPRFSVDMRSLTTPEASLERFTADHRGDTGRPGMVEFEAEDAYELEYDIRHEPENDNHAHAHVYGEFGSNQRKKRARKLALKCRVVVEPAFDG